MKITELFKATILSSLVILLTACSPRDIIVPLDLDFNALNYDTFMDDTVKKMASKVQKLEKAREVVLVTDFVNVDDLQNQSKLGFLLSSALKDTLTAKYDLTIREAKLGQHFKMGPQGFKLLSKNQNEIDPNVQPLTAYAFVGTYTVTSKQLIVFTQIIDIYTGHVLASTTNRARVTKEIKELDKKPRRANVYSPTVL